MRKTTDKFNTTTASCTDVGTKYLTDDELRPYSPPPTVREWHAMDAKLCSSHWHDQIDALNCLRCYAKFHPQTINQQQQNSSSPTNRATSGLLTTLIANVLPLVESLRSSVSKNALLCLHDVVFHYKRQTDSGIEGAVAVCLKKSADTNYFLAESADRTLDCISMHCSDTKAINAFVQQTKASRNQGVKARGSRCLAMIVRLKGILVVKLRDFGLLGRTLLQLTGETSSDCRNFARAGLAEVAHVLGSKIEAESALKKVLNDEEYSKLRCIYDKIEDVDTYFDHIIAPLSQCPP